MPCRGPGKRSLAVVGLVFGSILCGCLGKSALIDEAARNTLNGEYLLYLSNVQGNPLCMFVAVEQTPASANSRSDQTRWQTQAWLVFPGGTKHLLSEEGKEEKSPRNPLNLADESLLFTTDQDRFGYYIGQGSEKLLFLTEPLFAERALKVGTAEIRYGLLSAELYVNQRRTQGRVFYERKDTPRPARPFSDQRLEGWEAGSRCYALWTSGGEFISIQRGAAAQEGEGGWFAALYDRRGRWNETYEVRVTEAVPAESADSGPAIDIEIPAWGLAGRLTQVREIRRLAGGATEPDAAPEPSNGPRSIWASIETLEETGRTRADRFLLLEGDLRLGSESKGFQGLAFFPQGA
ncbi:MAG: hypothetical protein AB1640_11205 [bacterium]